MKARAGWLDGFVKWFFNASPVWVDEREAELEAAALRGSPIVDTPRNRRVLADRRRRPDPRGSTSSADRRRSHP